VFTHRKAKNSPASFCKTTAINQNALPTYSQKTDFFNRIGRTKAFKIRLGLYRNQIINKASIDKPSRNG